MGFTLVRVCGIFAPVLFTACSLSHMSPFCLPSAAWHVSPPQTPPRPPTKGRLEHAQRHLHFCISLWLIIACQRKAARSPLSCVIFFFLSVTSETLCLNVNYWRQKKKKKGVTFLESLLSLPLSLSFFLFSPPGALIGYSRLCLSRRCEASCCIRRLTRLIAFRGHQSVHTCLLLIIMRPRSLSTAFREISLKIAALIKKTSKTMTLCK